MGRMVNVTEGEVAAAGDVVEFVAEISPAEVGLEEICNQMNCKFDEREGEGELDGLRGGGPGGRRVRGGRRLASWA